MKFIKRIVTNLILLIVMGTALFIFFPDMMRQVYQLFGALFGPGVVALLVMSAALPGKPRKRS